MQSNDSSYVNTRYGMGAMFVTIGFFHVLTRFVGYCFVPFFIRNKGSDEVWKWCNLLVSWIHAIIVGCWDLLCFYYYPELLDDLIEFKNNYCYYLVVFSTGYFVYDFGDLIYRKKVFKMWELTFHHIAVTTMFLYNLISIRCIAYNVIALLCEVNSIFLHTRKLLQMVLVNSNLGPNPPLPIKNPAQYFNNNRIYKVSAVLNIVTFAVFRGYSLVRISTGMFHDNLKVDRFYFYSLLGSMTIMNLLNPILFVILVNNDFIRSCSKSKSAVKNTDQSDFKCMESNGNKMTMSNGDVKSNGTSSTLSSVITQRARKLTDSTLNIDEYKIE